VRKIAKRRSFAAIANNKQKQQCGKYCITSVIPDLNNRRSRNNGFE